MTFKAGQAEEILVPGLPLAPQPARLQVPHVILLLQNLHQTQAVFSCQRGCRQQHTPQILTRLMSWVFSKMAINYQVEVCYIATWHVWPWLLTSCSTQRLADTLCRLRSELQHQLSVLQLASLCSSCEGEYNFADLAFIAKLGQDSHQLSMGVVLLVDGQLGARLQLLLGVDDADVIDDGNLVLWVPQYEGPHPIQAMTWAEQAVGVSTPGWNAGCRVKATTCCIEHTVYCMLAALCQSTPLSMYKTVVGEVMG